MRDYASDLPVYLELDLLQAGWSGDISPYPGMNPRQFAMMSLRNSLVKKLQPSDTTEQDKKALELFLTVNSNCSKYIPQGAAQLPRLEYDALSEARDFISRFCMQYDPVWDLAIPLLSLHTITDGLGFGPGASIGSPSDDFLSKVGVSSMSATDPSLQLFFLQAISEDRVWADVESIRLLHRSFEIVPGSRLSFVPKSAVISRTICTEPLLNMMFQKGIGKLLEDRLRLSCGIDLRSQPFKNRLLARIGSETGRFGTIDLSSASDSMSLGLVHDFFPDHVVSWLMRSRSPVTILPDGTTCDLHMVSSMGNAFTFPLQTLFFLSLVYGAYRMLDIKFDRPTEQSLGSFAVFGDDIIVDSRAYDLVVRLLEICGFKVNVNKSFNTGDFRESCGSDFYKGHNVRGVYIQNLSTKYDCYSAINRLNDWSARHGILLHHVVTRLTKGLFKLYVPMHEGETAGIRVPCRVLERPRRGRNIGSICYRAFRPRPWEIQVSSPENAARYQGRTHGIYNPSAVLLAALAGTLRRGRVVRRLRQTRFRLVACETPSWDALPTEFDTVGEFLNGHYSTSSAQSQLGLESSAVAVELCAEQGSTLEDSLCKERDVQDVPCQASRSPDEVKGEGKFSYAVITSEAIRFSIRVLAGVKLPIGHPGWVDLAAPDPSSFGGRVRYVDGWKAIYEYNLDL